MKCDELKVYHCNEWHNEYTEFYMKSDADAAIDELKSAHHKERHEYIKMVVDLKEKHKTEVKELLCLIRDKENNFNRAFDSEEKQLRHYKYKHCLNMANKCVVLCNKSKDRYRWAEDENLEHYYNRKIEFFARWHNRWLKIAEKFKETK